MKKIITLLIAVGSFTTLLAQTPNEEARRIILGGNNKTPGGGTQNPRDIILGGGDTRPVYDESGKRYPDNYPYGSSREAQINEINREYDAKVYSIRNNPTLSYAEKERIIRQLNSERAQRIRQVNNQYDSKQNRRYDDDDDRHAAKHKQYKKDNGKHLGWEKGKGNGKKYKDKRYD